MSLSIKPAVAKVAVAKVVTEIEQNSAFFRPNFVRLCPMVTAEIMNENWYDAIRTPMERLESSGWSVFANIGKSTQTF